MKGKPEKQMSKLRKQEKHWEESGEGGKVTTTNRGAVALPKYICFQFPLDMLNLKISPNTSLSIPILKIQN